MLDFKSLTINDVTLWKRLLTSVLNFKSLVINDVALVVLYMRIYHIHLRGAHAPSRAVMRASRITSL
jgi:hypothetical protein